MTMNAINGVWSDIYIPGDYHPARITKAEKYFAKRLDFKDIKCPVKSRDFHNIEKKKILLALAFLVKKKCKTSSLCIRKML